MVSEYESTMNRFLKYLGESNPDRFTKQQWHLVWAYIKSDFCSAVADVMKWACVEHDFYYRTHCDFFGRPITFMQANKRFMKRMIKLSNPFSGSQSVDLVVLGEVIAHLNPMAWWRFAAVCLFAKSAWEGKQSYHD